MDVMFESLVRTFSLSKTSNIVRKTSTAIVCKNHQAIIHSTSIACEEDFSFWQVLTPIIVLNCSLIGLSKLTWNELLSFEAMGTKFVVVFLKGKG